MTAPVVPVTPASVLTRSDDVLHQDVGGEAVLLDLASEQYFGLDAVGTRIWELLDGSMSLERVHALLCAEYEAEPPRIAADLMTLANALLSAGLVKSD